MRPVGGPQGSDQSLDELLMCRRERRGCQRAQKMRNMVAEGTDAQQVPCYALIQL